MTVGLDRTGARDDVVIDHVVADVLAQLQRTKETSAEVFAVRVLVEREWARHNGARVRTFLPVLVLRAVVAQLLGPADTRPSDQVQYAGPVDGVPAGLDP